MADNLNYFFDDEESGWLANIDPSLLDKSNEEKQLDDNEISSFIKENRNSNTAKKRKTDLAIVFLIPFIRFPFIKGFVPKTTTTNSEGSLQVYG